METKELLTLIEGHVNTHRLVIAPSCTEAPAFRAGVITAHHAASSLAQIRDKERGGPAVAPLRGITADPNVKTLQRLSGLRNLCMHYEPKGPAVAANTFGGAVALLAKRPLDEVAAMVDDALVVMSDGLRAWGR